MPTPNPNGNSDAFFISWVRRKLRDQAAWFAQTIPTTGTDGVVTAGAKPYRLQRAPVQNAAGTSITAPSPVNSGVTSFFPVFDTTIPGPTQTPILSDGGAGALAAGTYFILYTFVGASGESAFFTSSPIVLAAAHQISVASITGIPASATSVRFYLLSVTAASSTSGFVTAVTPVAGATGVVAINAAGNGVLPVDVITPTGEIIFPAAPAAGNLSIAYQAYRFSDQQILDALNDGLKLLYPQIWQLAFDTSLIPSPVFFEYVLPAVFADMRVVLMNVELRIPNITVIPYKRYKGWSRPNPLTLAFLHRFSPAGNIRLSYNSPYGALSDLEPIAMMLPCYYAMALLLKEQEAMRTRATEMVPQTGEGGSKSGDATATSRDWMDLYIAEVDRLSRPTPFRPDPQQVYELA